jgi:hypothetical protein
VTVTRLLEPRLWKHVEQEDDHAETEDRRRLWLFWQLWGRPMSAPSGIVMLSLRINPLRSHHHHHHPPAGFLTAGTVRRTSEWPASLPASRASGLVRVCSYIMSSSPDSGLSLEEQLERKWSLENLECVDVQTLISMW